MKKKLLLLLFFLLFLTGCYDYKEVSDLAFITAVGVDYEDDEYEITIEIVKNKSSDQGQNETTAFNESAKGQTITKAFDELSFKMVSYPYYYHLKVLAISENVAKTKIKDIIDYTTRGSEIRNEFYLIVTNDISAKKLIETTNENAPVVGETIMKMIQNSSKVYSSAYEKMYEDNLKTFLNDGIDTITSSFTVGENEIEVSGVALFKDFEYLDTLGMEQSALLNSLITKKTNYLLTKEYDNEDFIINVYSVSPEFKFAKNGDVNINLKIQAEIKLNTPGIDLKKDDIYEKINNDFAMVAKEKYENLFDTFKEMDVDPVGLGLSYYKKTRKKNYEIFKNKINVEVDMKINKNGLIYEVD